MSKTTIPTGGITADAIDATLIADDAISEEHLDATAITGTTALAETPSSTDELLISDGGTLKRLDFNHIFNTPSFSAYLAFNSTQNISDATLTKVNLNTEHFDSDSTFDHSTNYRFTCPTGGAGKYLFSWQIFLYAANTSSNIEYANTKLYKNGSAYVGTDMDYRDNEPRAIVLGNSVILDVADDDYFELYGLVKQNSGSPSFYGGDRMTYFSGMKVLT